MARLAGIADLFLVHDRPVARHVDDSVVRIILGREQVLRRARGYAPLPVHVSSPLPPLLAVGAHLKNAVAVAHHTEVFVSQHIGDLETPQAYDAFRRVCDDFTKLYHLNPRAVACDSHPDYLSTRHAVQTGLPLVRVQHHYAHVLACMAENGLGAPVLGVSWDGTGYGLDRTVWGGEFLRITDVGFERIAHLRSFPLPGGEQAVREPRRTAVGLLYEMEGDAFVARENLPPIRSFGTRERRLLARALTRRVNSPLTTSAGRLFDGVAALLGIRLATRFEGQAAMELEWAMGGVVTDEAYPFRLAPKDDTMLVDWEPLIRSLVTDVEAAVPVAVISCRFHNALAEMVVAIAQLQRVPDVVLSGGCFQNRYLTERVAQRLIETGYTPHWHQRVPPNDGGIAVGQLLAAARAEE